METDGERPKSQPLRVDGHTFWRAKGARGAVELTTATGIELDETRCRWSVSAPGASGRGEAVESASREVRSFIGGVLAEMQRAAHRAIVRPVPKPEPKRPAPLPPSAPVPCPLCRGEAWPDCDVCDSTGIVTQRQADEWHDRHGD